MRWPGGGSASEKSAPDGCKRRHQRQDRVEVERALDHVGQPVEMRHQVGMLAGLDQAEMALGQRQRRVAQDRADDRQADRLDGVARQPAVALAAQPVEHHAGDPAPPDRRSAKPLAMAAAVCDWPETSSTSSTGRP